MKIYVVTEVLDGGICDQHICTTKEDVTEMVKYLVATYGDTKKWDEDFSIKEDGFIKDIYGELIIEVRDFNL
jgi:hypothetical protein